MKKLNNKGFFLIETVVVSVFVLTIFVLIYQNSIPMIDEYQHRIKYDDVDSVYAIGLVRNLVLGDVNYNSFKTEVDSVGYKEITCDILTLTDRCNVVFEQLGVIEGNHVVLTKWDVTNVSKSTTLPNDFIDYVFYLKDQNQEEITTYRLLVSRTSKYEREIFNQETQMVETEEKIQIHYANVGM